MEPQGCPARAARASGAGRTQASGARTAQPDSGRCSVLLLTSPSILWEA